MNELASRLRACLVKQLIGRGALRSERWIQAFLSVPRHELVPEVFTVADDGMTYTKLTAADGEHWLRTVYADEALVTQLHDGAPTSSSSAPSLMAEMLEALDVTDTSRVLEFGTGTGYNVALLCAGLSDEQVASMDIHRGLVVKARKALTRLGYRPTLDVGDGDSATLGGTGQHDRLIVTYGVPDIPAGWLHLIEPGGVIVAPLHREQSVGAMVRLVVESSERASGHFLAAYGAFMPTRTRVARVDIAAVRAAAERGEAVSRASVLPRMVAGAVAEPWQFYAALTVGDVCEVDVLPEGVTDPAQMEHWLIAADGSWACQHTVDGELLIREGGQRCLWAELEAVYGHWHELGKPDRERFGFTVTPDGCALWLDEPGHVLSADYAA